MFDGWKPAKYHRAPPKAAVSARQVYARCPWLHRIINSAETITVIHTIEDAEEKAWAQARFSDVCAEEDRRLNLAHGYATEDEASTPAPEADRYAKQAPTPPDLPCTQATVERILYDAAAALGPIEVDPVLVLRVSEKTLRNKVAYVTKRMADGEAIRSPEKLLLSLLRKAKDG